METGIGGMTQNPHLHCMNPDSDLRTLEPRVEVRDVQPLRMALSERFLVLTLTAILIGMISAPGITPSEALEPAASEMSIGTKAGTTEWTAVAGYPSQPPTQPSIGVAAGYISPSTVAVDTLGNVYTGGFVIYDVSFGSQAYSDVEQMAYVAKASSTGTWQKLYYTSVFGGGGSATVTAISTSGTDVYACGWFIGNVSIGTQNFQSYTPSGSVNSSQDIWVAKFDQNLNPLWAKQAGTVENDDACEDLVVSPTNPDGSQDVYLIGETNATAQSYFGTSITRNGIGGTSTDIFIAKMSASNGAWNDAKITGGQAQDLGQSIAWRGGGIVATGLFSGTANFGSQQMQAIGSYDLWIADASTNLAWANASQAGGTAGIVQPFGIVQQNGVDYIAGTVRGTVNFDTNQVMSSSNGQDTSTFVASRGGVNNQWDWITTANGYHQVRDIDIDSAGVILVTGSFATVSWSGTGGSLQQSGSGTWGSTTLSSTYFDPFHATMDSSNGNWISADAGSGSFDDNGIGGVWSPNGQIIGMGTFGTGGPTNIGSTYTLTLGSGSVIGNGNAFTDQNYQIYGQIGAYIWSLKSDSDSDGTPDVDDNCPDLFNPSQSDIDGDTLGDECDPDADDDGILNENDNCDGPETNWDPTDTSLDRDQDGCKDATEDTDDDADGIDDLTDACDDIGDKMGWISNNVYDHDQDGCHDIDEDDDDDNDYVQDTVDLCPRGWFNWSTSATTDHDGDGCHDEGEDDDDDNDGMFDMTLDEQPLDKCPKGDLGWISDATTDRDSDGCRDEGEDTDDDDDTIPDDDDGCTPDGDLDWTSVAMLDHDGDGCRDATEDDDDDNDSILDANDSCPTGLTGWTSTVLLDVDGDGCQDNVEDTDNDNDGVANALDGCPSGETGWFASNELDADGDGCRDETEDTDDDEDSVLDENDACPNTPLGEAADPAGCGYNTQQDNDGDGIYDIDDACLNTPSESTRLFGKTLTSEANGQIYEWGTDIDVAGCWFGELDRDNDGVQNYLDQCPDTDTGAFIDAFGCAAEEYDWDKDGIIGDVVLNPDLCPGTSDAATRDNHTEFGGIDGFGCWAGDADTDSDQVPAHMDMCPGTDEFATVSKDLESPEIMGCADNQLDFDNDGITNDLDICPDTPVEIDVQNEGERIGCSLEQRVELGDLDAVVQKNVIFIVIATLVLIALLGGLGFVLMRGGNSNSPSGAEMMMAQQAAPMMQAAAPPGFSPAQPTHVADYTGLPGGGHYDQGYDGSTIYIAPDATQWRMNADGSFTRV